MATATLTKERSRPRAAVVCSAQPALEFRSHGHQVLLGMAVYELIRLHEQVVKACLRCEDNYRIWLPERGFGFVSFAEAARFMLLLGRATGFVAAQSSIRRAVRICGVAYGMRWCRRVPPKYVVIP